MTLLFEPPTPTLAPTTDGRLLPIRRVFCVGRNYAAHAREMGYDPDREPPFFFTKWADTVVLSGTEIAYPQQTRDFHYEAELVVAIGKGGRDIAPDAARDHIFGYASGLDMTRRDLQMQARSMGRPWDTGKNVEQSAPLGMIHPVSEIGHVEKGPIILTVNGAVKQSADLADLIWPTADVIAFLSRMYTLEPGDLIYTGTPEGVGPVSPGDEIVVVIADLAPTVIKIGAPLGA